VPVFALDDRLLFPPVECAEDGLLAVGGDLKPQRLTLAYSQGIFPWYSRGQPILWYSPDPRLVLVSRRIHVPRSLQKTMKRRPFRLTMDTAFEEVIDRCGRTPRPGQTGTWITPAMRRAYIQLHKEGLAHSAEAWRGGELAGGLYGVSLGGAFFGESMFTVAPDASKIAFVALVEQLTAWDVSLVDCQVYTEHLARFGAEEWSRKEYLTALARALERPTRRGKWRFGNEESGASSAPPGT